MRVLFDHPLPFQLAHGGAQIQIEQTKAGLEALGVDVEWLRWWDDSQKADIIHFFSRPHSLYSQLTKASGRHLVISELLTGQASWSAWKRFPHKVLRHVNRALGRRLDGRFHLDSYQRADAITTLTKWEQQLITELYDAPPERVSVVPNGVEEVFFLEGEPGSRKRNEWLVCTATITPRKRVVELAEAAIQAEVPIHVVGRPYFETDPYYLKFLEVVRRSGGLVRFDGPVEDRSGMAEIYQSARGFVLLSTMESLSLSALEAAAAHCPLLLTDLPWARCTFDNDVSYAPLAGTAKTAEVLKRFYEAAPRHPIPSKPLTWKDVAAQLKGLYEQVLNERG